MNTQPIFKTPWPGVFRPPTGRLLQATTFGFSRLALQFMAVLLVGLTILLFATLKVADLRRGATDAVIRSLLVQADATAAAFHQLTPETPYFTLLPVDGRTPAAGAPAPQGGIPAPASTEIDRPGVSDVIATVLQDSIAQVRIFGADGEPIFHSELAVEQRGSPVLKAPVAPVAPAPSLIRSVWEAIAGLWLRPSLPLEPAEDAVAADLDEAVSALGGVKTVSVRADANADTLISVATPITDASGTVLAALHLRSAPGAVTGIAYRQELAIVRIFLIAGLIAIVVSIVLAATVTMPIRRLARAADRIRSGGVSAPIPELSDGGEIGELSRVLHDMTVALYTRIDSIEAFADEVAHELKNPLTSLRSAAETLPRVTAEASRLKLLDVIEHDVRRIDRLITDIADASKLDAELNRHGYARYELIELIEGVVTTQAELGREQGKSVEFVVRGTKSTDGFVVVGNDGRLAQVFTNLVDNARSFTPDNGRVVVTAQRFANFIEVVVDDEGPGIAEDSLERIFERFYTDRSEQRSFGNNSGLGLAISRQIIEAHNGEIFAENRYRTTLGPARDVAGARFTVRLPVTA
ncbi:HAMP domain-containing sensor histidine kinase [Acuticoccus sp. MNP-M23]|uniref:sensor histidine kinase n=1 Tax=Acuticoccus sp. MNP-M23 TaxID=3072793 RepID=UPI0028152E0C|nr:HAMP domain-containing sensor histidine kinase [Acuticoccus sp. MNP-M23]WMS44265.1 HAMP domain-containing sensor histidine kinase [Acuticoccus sp. MNP-M23]